MFKIGDEVRRKEKDCDPERGWSHGNKIFEVKDSHYGKIMLPTFAAECGPPNRCEWWDADRFELAKPTLAERIANLRAELAELEKQAHAEEREEAIAAAKDLVPEVIGKLLPWGDVLGFNKKRILPSGICVEVSVARVKT